MPRKRIAFLAIGAALGAVAALSGCSRSNGSIAGLQSVASPAPSTGGGSPAGGSPATSINPLQGILGSGGPLDVSTLCAAVPTADIQKLFKAPAPSLVSDPGECNWGSGGITVDIFPNDADKSLYGGGAVSVASAAHLSGVGDIAQWSQPIPGHTVPFLVAHEGTTSISVSPSLDVDQTTIAFTGSAPFFDVSKAEALKYAIEEGRICTDIFSAMGT